MIFYILHPFVTRQVFSMLDCQQYGDQSYLTVDLSISCTDETYLLYRKIAYAMLLYCVGLPLLGIFLVFRNRKNFSDPEVIVRYRFLFQGYKRKWFFWEGLIILRKIAFIAVAVSGNSAPAQINIGLWILLFSSFFHLIAKPFTETARLAQRMEFFALVCLIVTLLAGQGILVSSTSAQMQMFWSVLMLMSNGVLTLAFVVLLTLFFWKVLFRKTVDVEVERKFKDRLSRFEKLWDNLAGDETHSTNVSRYPASMEMSRYGNSSQEIASSSRNQAPDPVQESEYESSSLPESSERVSRVSGDSSSSSSW